MTVNTASEARQADQDTKKTAKSEAKTREQHEDEAAVMAANTTPHQTFFQSGSLDFAIRKDFL